MKRVLKNYQPIHVKGMFRGKEIYFGPKHSQIFDMDNEEERNKYFYWKDTFGFIQDYTSRTEVNKL